MEPSYFTIGMAGHIDHGKTTLTKALTSIDTDRLKAEKERNISIELGFAPLQMDHDVQVSIVDVPGHERFIRQMIAGVAGIDMVVLVIAADEGVMPQTREHLEIIHFLGIKHCLVVISKIDQVEDELLELVEEDIREELAGTIFEKSQFAHVDSVSGKGIDEFKKIILNKIKEMEKRDAYGSFRLPIDQVFTIKGQGTIVRGTIYEGAAHKGSQLTVLPAGHKVKARQIQVHQKEVEVARAGQRTAINLGGISMNDIKRGDVLVDSDHFIRTNTIDVTLTTVSDIASPLKQRAPVGVYTGTSEVSGKIVFFDRNELINQDAGEILCQIRLDEHIVARRGDRFILRRPTPVETLGGGWIIQPIGGKYRFGEETINMLQMKKEGTPEDLIQSVLSKHMVLDEKQLIQLTSINEDEIKSVLLAAIEKERILEFSSEKYVLNKTLLNLQGDLIDKLTSYHKEHCMSQGMDKAELVQLLSEKYPKAVIEFGLNQLINNGELLKSEQFLSLSSFMPHLPKAWQVRMEKLTKLMENDGLTTSKWDEYVEATGIPIDKANELKVFLIYTNEAYQLTGDLLIHRDVFNSALSKLKQQTDEKFTIKEAKEILEISRKYIVPYLELLDKMNLTIRQEDVRKWC